MTPAPTGPDADDAPVPDPSARRAAVLGHPIAHSLSPVLHRAAYAALGLHHWTYELRDVTPAGLPEVVAALDETWAGLSVTMPLKQAVIGLLDHVEPLAQAVGAVNTVLVQRAGRGRVLVGANTDVHGMVAALAETGYEQRAGTPSAVVLGGGATAASAIAALGHVGVTRPAVVVRSPGRAGAVVVAAGRMGLEPVLVRWDRAGDLLAGVDLLVSTVPRGAADALAPLLAAAPPADGAALLDVVYEPWPTPLAQAWQAHGGLVAPGWAMLLHQAAEQVRLMTGEVAPVEAMRTALLEALASRSTATAPV